MRAPPPCSLPFGFGPYRRCDRALVLVTRLWTHSHSSHVRAFVSPNALSFFSFVSSLTRKFSSQLVRHRSKGVCTRESCTVLLYCADHDPRCASTTLMGVRLTCSINTTGTLNVSREHIALSGTAVSRGHECGRVDVGPMRSTHPRLMLAEIGGFETSGAQTIRRSCMRL